MSYLKENKDKNTKVYLFNMKCAQNKHQVIKSMTLDYISNKKKKKMNLRIKKPKAIKQKT